MSKITGHVNEEGSFSLKAVFDPQNSDDMAQMLRLIHDEDMNATVEDYGEDFVAVTYRPSDLNFKRCIDN